MPASAGWWLRVLTVGLFIFHINYIRFHLLTETHLDDFHLAIAESGDHDDGHHDADHQESGHHRPHPVSDHLIQMASKHQPSLLAVDFLPVEKLACLAPPDRQVVRPDFERGKFPRESPPDPLQPRAPPIA
jgi:hypothetical protein